MEQDFSWVEKRLKNLESDELKSEEFKRVILEIGECLKQGSITPTFQMLLDTYKKEIK